MRKTRFEKGTCGGLPRVLIFMKKFLEKICVKRLTFLSGYYTIYKLSRGQRLVIWTTYLEL